MTKKSIKIAISACLLGEKVRYDGQHKCHHAIIRYLKENTWTGIEWFPFCPEVGIGLGVPRDKIQLQQLDERIHALGVINHTWDVTNELTSYAADFIGQEWDIDCYIVKSKSPSCGYRSTPLFHRVEDKNQFLSYASGLFTQTVMAMRPQVSIIEETQLESEKECQQLLQRLTKR